MGTHAGRRVGHLAPPTHICFAPGAIEVKAGTLARRLAHMNRPQRRLAQVYRPHHRETGSGLSTTSPGDWLSSIDHITGDWFGALASRPQHSELAAALRRHLIIQGRRAGGGMQSISIGMWQRRDGCIARDTALQPGILQVSGLFCHRCSQHCSLLLGVLGGRRQCGLFCRRTEPATLGLPSLYN